MEFEIPFNNLDRDFQLRLCSIPQHVPATKDPDQETDRQIQDNQSKYLSLSIDARQKLSDSETGTKIQTIGNSFGMSILQIADIARAVRSYYFGELKLEDMPFYLAKEIPIELSKAQEITRIVVEKIINDRSIEQARQAELENITLSEALKKYPEIGEQLITSDRINIKSFPEPARPSIKNWLADYTFVLGYGTHDAIARANYMFQGTNARTLASTDRERLAYILKAYDENTLVTVDKNEKKIVFPANNQETRNNNQANFKSQIQNPQMHSSELNSQESRMNLKSSTLGTPSTPRSSAPEAQNPRTMNQEPRTSNISYSSPQKLPYEKMRTQQQPYRITPIYGQQKKEEPKKDERILNKNVVDLRDSM